MGGGKYMYINNIHLKKEYLNLCFFLQIHDKKAFSGKYQAKQPMNECLAPRLQGRFEMFRRPENKTKNPHNNFLHF